MRLKTNKTKRGVCYYIIRSVNKNGKSSTETVEKLGYLDDIKEQYGCDDPMLWIEQRMDFLNEQERTEKNKKVLIPLDANALIPSDAQQSFNIGYLFLQKIYYELKLDLICAHISKRHAFKYDINEIMSRLIFGRILFPGSKLSTYRQSFDLLEQPNFQYHQIQRALSVIAEEFGTIQTELYKNSTDVIDRKTGVLYYDCTNFYFETEYEDPISNADADENDIAARKYAHSKQHQPSPLVQMGLFMDYSGMPLAMCLDRGNKNEQLTLIPLEEKILQDFELSRFIVCTDAGLSSVNNRKFNNFGERSFISTISIKEMKKKQKEWCLDPSEWHLEGSNEIFAISHLEDTEEDAKENYEKIFYKECIIDGYDEERDISFDQILIVTYSLKYRDYLRRTREAQVERAQKLLDSGRATTDAKNQNDCRRFIKKKAVGKDKQDAAISYSLDNDAIQKEQKYDGFYAVVTNLAETDVSDIIKVNKGRWEIEESFRIMKNDFLSRPVYLSLSERIKAHFLTCFISLLVYRILERKLGCQYTCGNIVDTLRKMNMTKVKDIGYIPSYTRTGLTDALHENVGFRTDYEITRDKAMKGIIRKSKQR